MPQQRSLAHLTRLPPPTCLPNQGAQCSEQNHPLNRTTSSALLAASTNNGTASLARHDVKPCRCTAERFFRAPKRVTLPVAPGAWKGLRIFFLDGHSGPMNDMIATLLHAGVESEAIDGMLMAQAEQKRNFIDVFSSRLRGRNTAYSVPERCRGRLLGVETSLALHSFLRGSAGGGMRGGCLLLNNCERKRCRSALESDGLRREFARRFGAAFERSVDVVACNFPTWQCALFMYVNVAVVLRFTHRWDHHLQGYYSDPGVAARAAATWSELMENATSSGVAVPSDALRSSMAISAKFRAERRAPRRSRGW